MVKKKGGRAVVSWKECVCGGGQQKGGDALEHEQELDPLLKADLSTGPLLEQDLLRPLDLPVVPREPLEFDVADVAFGWQLEFAGPRRPFSRRRIIIAAQQAVCISIKR